MNSVQVYGIQSNSRQSSIEPAKRIFLKPGSSAWDCGSRTVRRWRDLAAEVELVARVEEFRPYDYPVPRLSFALGYDIGSGGLGTEDGQWWRSKGGAGYTPVGEFAETAWEQLRDAQVVAHVERSGDVEVCKTTIKAATDPETFVEYVSQYCEVQAGDLFLMGALIIIEDVGSVTGIRARAGNGLVCGLDLTPEGEDWLRLSRTDTELRTR